MTYSKNISNHSRSQSLTPIQATVHSALKSYAPIGSAVSLKTFRFPGAVSDQHKVLVSPVAGDSSSANLISSLPNISNKIFLSVTNANPEHFSELIASFNAESECNDALCEGHCELVDFPEFSSTGWSGLLLTSPNQLIDGFPSRIRINQEVYEFLLLTLITENEYEICRKYGYKNLLNQFEKQNRDLFHFNQKTIGNNIRIVKKAPTPKPPPKRSIPNKIAQKNMPLKKPNPTQKKFPKKISKKTTSPNYLKVENTTSRKRKNPHPIYNTKENIYSDKKNNTAIKKVSKQKLQKPTERRSQARPGQGRPTQTIKVSLNVEPSSNFMENQFEKLTVGNTSINRSQDTASLKPTIKTDNKPKAKATPKNINKSKNPGIAKKPIEPQKNNLSVSTAIHKQSIKGPGVTHKKPLENRKMEINKERTIKKFDTIQKQKPRTIKKAKTLTPKENPIKLMKTPPPTQSRWLIIGETAIGTLLLIGGLFSTLFFLDLDTVGASIFPGIFAVAGLLTLTSAFKDALNLQTKT